MADAEAGQGLERRVEVLSRPILRASEFDDARHEIAAGSRPRWRNDAIKRRMLGLADAIAAVAASLVATGGGAGTLWALAVLPVWILIAKLLGLYDHDHRAIRVLTIDELPQICAWAGIGTAVLVGILSLTPTGSVTTAGVFAGFCVAAAAALALRSLARVVWRRTVPLERSLIVGSPEAVEQVERKLTLFPDMHLRPVGWVDASALGDELAEGGEGRRKLDALLGGVERLIVAGDSVRPDAVAAFAAACRGKQVKLSVVSPLRGHALPAPRISQVADLPVLEFDTTDVSRSTILVKRAIDIVVGAVGMLLTLLVLPFVALAIKLDSRGPVFFSQRRAGRGGEPFRIFKFRTMAVDAEQRLEEVVRLDQLEEPMFKLSDDPRVTRVGRVLRALSIDELPQSYNVLRGEMSLVGPRPEQIDIVELYRPQDRFRLEVKPGITGPMQVYGRGRLTFAERLAVEREYVENLSVARDLRLIALTIPAVFHRKGAF